MQRLQKLVKSIRISRVVMIFMAGVLVLLNTACKPQAPNVSGTGLSNERKAQQTELYAPNQEKKGGINRYNDVESSADNRGDLKAKELVDSARSNLRKSIDTPEDLVENYKDGAPLGERVKRLSNDVGESIENTANDVTDAAQRGVRNTQRNTENAAERATRSVERGAEEASDFAQDRTRDAARATDRATNRAGRAAERAIDDATDRVGNPG